MDLGKNTMRKIAFLLLPAGFEALGAKEAPVAGPEAGGACSEEFLQGPLHLRH